MHPNKKNMSMLKQRCTTCNKEASKLKLCTCLTAQYCNSKCQSKHWCIHKKFHYLKLRNKKKSRETDDGKMENQKTTTNKNNKYNKNNKNNKNNYKEETTLTTTKSTTTSMPLKLDKKEKEEEEKEEEEEEEEKRMTVRSV